MINLYKFVKILLMIKKYLLFILSLLAFDGVVAQQLPEKIIFDYDASGNQVYRGIVIEMTGYGLRSNALPEMDNEEDMDEEMPSFGYDNAKLRYYPNPVENILNIEWDKEYKRVDFMILYTSNLQKLKEVGNLSRENHTNIDFGYLPPGSYYLTVFYLDGTKETITLIKR
jgi:hypothetical protein